jgi:two-component system chemotaxis response regulator CheY
VSELVDESDQGRVMRRLEAMGVRARLMAGGRCVLASMQSSGKPLETLNGSLPFNEFVFSTVGNDKIKCLRPQALFVLPLIPVANCTTAAQLETRIRTTWTAYVKELRSAEDWLRNLGADVSAASTGEILSVSIAGARRSIKVQVNQPRKVILPSSGPLSRISLMRAEDRTLEIDPCIDSAVDLELIVGSRLEELAKLDKRLKEEERRRGMWNPAAVTATAESTTEQPLRILLVGPKLANEHSCIDSLRLRNYEVLIARNLNEAVGIYNHISPELVLADVNLGRSDGIELIASLRKVVGIEEIPVVLVDGHRREALRTAAKQAGALGYLTYPIEITKISSRLEEIIRRPKRRRFTRYLQRTAVTIHGSNLPATTVAIGRGGMMIRTDSQFSINSIQSCNLSLSTLGKNLDFDAEVLYQRNDSGQHEVGLRFQAMSAQNEENLINYLHCLH